MTLTVTITESVTVPYKWAVSINDTAYDARTSQQVIDLVRAAAERAIDTELEPADHVLEVVSYHDGIAECSCGKWRLTRTGAITRAEAEREHYFHAHGNFPERAIDSICEFCDAPKDAGLPCAYCREPDQAHTCTCVEVHDGHCAFAQDATRQAHVADSFPREGAR